MLTILGLCGPARAQIPGAPATQQKLPAEPATPQTGPAENAGNQVLHILVGHSVVIRTDPRLQRVLVGNSAVVTTATTAPNDVVVTATAAGSSSVILWQENNQSRIIEVFADVDVSLLREAITRGLPGEAVEAESEEGRVDRTKLTAFGFNLLSTGATNTIGTTTTQQFGTLSLGDQGKLTGIIGAPTRGTTTSETISDLLNIFIFRPDLNLGATIRDLQQRNVLQILAEPDLLAANGEAARFLAGGELPYPVVSGAAGQSTVSVQFKPFGVKLEFTGYIESDNTIRLKVFPEVSSLDFTNAVTISGFVLPAIATRHAETVVELRDGQSFGIAGLLDQRTTSQFSKVPGIGDLPILGQLFRSRSVSKTNSELIVIVTPTIVDPAATPASAPELPKMPIAPLEQKQFDTKVPHGNGSK